MGGRVFTAAASDRPALHVPRIPSALYVTLRDKLLTQLADFYQLVGCPTESPEKSDFGDIDLCVAQPISSRFEQVWNEVPAKDQAGLLTASGGEVSVAVLLHVLSARRQLRNGSTRHYAIPHPEIDGAVIQLDVSLQPAELFAWTVFHNSYGDIWNMIGSNTRTVGLTVSDTGLYVRDADIEDHDRKRSRTFLSREPAQVLGFLGLDYGQWCRGWDRETAMFQYVTTGRFFDSEKFLRKSTLNADDRKRILSRSSYRRFVEDFVPVLALTESKANSEMAYEPASYIGKAGHGASRADVLEEALDTFSVRDAFLQNRKSWNDEQAVLAEKRQTKAQRRATQELLHSKATS